MQRRFASLLVASAGILAVAAPAAPAAPAAWHPATAPIMTRWADRVSVNKPWPEYPRPQMTRRDWANLNGLWEYAIATGEQAPAQYDGAIRVPFPVESALSGVMKPVRPNQTLWYRRTFTVPAGWRRDGKRVLLHFGAVDWSTEVRVNGTAVGSHKGGYDGFSFDVTDNLKPEGPQELVVAVTDPTDTGNQPRGKQTLRPGGIMYTPTTGIWQTVWLEPVPAASIRSLHITPDIDHGAVRLVVEAAGADGAVVTATASDGSTIVGRAKGTAGMEMTVPVPNPRLWWPDDPVLYNLRVTLSRDGKDVDSVGSYFGMRKIALGKDEAGITRPLLNNKFVFQVGPLDQGFWPDGIYTAPTDEALRWDIEVTKRYGFNMARKHVKVEPDRWYYWCDRLGLLVWQDMPSGDNRTPEAREEFESELTRVIHGRWSHPSIIQWVVFNEGWGQYDTERVVPWVRQMDPSRLVDNASGWTDRKVGDVIDMHNYPGPGSPKPEATRAAVLGEFGGLGLRIPGHTWKQEGWGYRQEADQKKLTAAYVKLLQHAWGLKDSAGLSAVVYTQTTDVEVELNGLLTYDRKVYKVDPERAAEANTGKAGTGPVVSTVLPSAQDGGQTWRYTTTAPGADWYKSGFSDAAWQSGPSGFGTQMTPGSVVRTTWNTGDIWIRRHFTLSSDSSNLRLWMHHDEDADVYVNGVKALAVTGYTSEYDTYDLEPAAARALHEGDNVIAIHCHQTGGGQYIDAGLVRER